MTITDTRTERVQFLMTPAEKLRATQAAQAAGVSLGALARSGLGVNAPAMPPGEIALHMMRAQLPTAPGHVESATLLRAVAETGTADTGGLLGVHVVPDLVAFVDANRRAVAAAFGFTGPRGDMPAKGKTFTRPRVTTFGAAGAQTEKAQLASAGFATASDTLTKTTHGRVEQVTEQDVDWADESWFQSLTEWLAMAYAIDTEATYTAAIASKVTTNTVVADVTSASAIIGIGLPAAQLALIASAGVPGDAIYCGKDAFAVLSGAPATVFGPLVPRIVYSPGFAHGFVAVGVTRLMEVFETPHGLVADLPASVVSTFADLTALPASLEHSLAWYGYLVTNIYAAGLCGIVAA